MMKYILLFLFPLSVFPQSHSISGRISDASDNSPLPGANAFISSSKSGCASDLNGYFRLFAKSDSISVVFSYIGFQTRTIKFFLSNDTILDIQLKKSIVLDAVSIEAEKRVNIIDNIQTSSIDVSPLQVKNMPRLFGDADLVRTLTFLPGVSNGAEGNMGMYIRGGSPDQNMILMDGMPLYNSSHIMGFFSLFNAETIESVDLIKGGFPARFSGRLASVLDIKMKQGDFQKYSADLSVGPISAKAVIQGPIWKNKTSFLVSGRSSYINLLTKPILTLMNNNKGSNSIEQNVIPGFFFYDINLSLAHRFNEKSKIWLTAYTGRDRINSVVQNFKNTMRTDFVFDMKWINVLSILNFEHRFNDKIKYHASVSYGLFDYRTQQSYVDNIYSNNSVRSTVNNYFSIISDYSFRNSIVYKPVKNHVLRIGMNFVWHSYLVDANVFKINQSPGRPVPDADAPKYNGKEFSVFAEDEMAFGKRWKVGLGIAYSGYSIGRSYNGLLQPRGTVSFKASENWVLKAAYARMFQPMLMLSNYGIGLPTDLWVPATERIHPLSSNDITAGIGSKYSILNSDVEFSLDGYYREMNGVAEYKDGASYLGNSVNWEDLIATGNGYAYGMELFIRKSSGKFTGWMGYTLSWTNRKIAEINNGQIFPYRYDRRHAVNIVLSYQFTPKISATVTWTYGTGNAITMPTTQYQGNYAQFDYFYPSTSGSSAVNDLTYRNNFRMQAYHRLDIGLNFYKQKKWGSRLWTLSIYNVYSRQNPYLYYLNYENNGTKSLYKLALFPIIPSVTYTVKIK